MVELEVKSKVCRVMIHGFSDYWRRNVGRVTESRCYKCLSTRLLLDNHFVDFELWAMWHHLISCRWIWNVLLLLQLSSVCILVHRTVGGLVIRGELVLMRVVLLLEMAHLSVAPSRLDVLGEISQRAHRVNRAPTDTAVDQELRLKLDGRELPPQNLAQALLMAACRARLGRCWAMRLRDLLADGMLPLHDPLLWQLWLLTPWTHHFRILMLLWGPLRNVLPRVLQEGLLALDMLHAVLLEAEVVVGCLNPHLLTLDAYSLAIRLGYSREPGYSRQNVLLIRFGSLWRTSILCLEVYLLDGSLRFDRRSYLNFLIIGCDLKMGRMLR